MSERTDIHRPSVINPADYDFVAYGYMGPNAADSDLVRVQRMLLTTHMARTGGRFSGHEHGGSCYVCGASALYTAIFHHRATNAYVKTGLECAEKMGDYTGESFRRAIKVEGEALAGKRKARAILEEAGLARAWEVYTAKLDREHTRDEFTVLDMVGKLVKYGSISDKAMAFLRTLVERIEKRPTIEAARAAERDAAAPVPVTDKRIAIRGTVLAVKPSNGPFGGFRMTVKTPEGWVVNGTKPGGLDVERGMEVEFVAAVRASDTDPKFGFFSRPTNSRIYSAPEEIAAPGYADDGRDLNVSEERRPSLMDLAAAFDR